MGFYKDWFREQTFGKNVIFRVGNAVENESEKNTDLFMVNFILDTSRRTRSSPKKSEKS